MFDIPPVIMGVTSLVGVQLIFIIELLPAVVLTVKYSCVLTPKRGGVKLADVLFGVKYSADHNNGPV
jgi:hypothetical protein